MVASLRSQILPDLAWNRLGDYLHETRLLGSIQNTLYWDQNTTMPTKSASWRGDQLSLMARNLHARQCSEHFEVSHENEMPGIWRRSNCSWSEKSNRMFIEEAKRISDFFLIK